MSLLLDTNTVIALINEKPPLVRTQMRRAQLAKEQVLLSTVVLHELWLGVMRSRRQFETAERLRAFLRGDVEVTDFDEEDAERAGELRHALAAKGTPIGPYDVLIAAQGLKPDRILVTANMSEFSRVEGLKLRNWLDD